MAVYEDIKSYTVSDEGGRRTVMRRFLVEQDYNNFLSRPYPVAMDALGELAGAYPGETRYGDPLPDDESLKVRKVDAQRSEDSPNLAEVLVYYGSPEGTLQIPGEFLRYDIDVSANSVHETVDLDRNPIGWDWETLTANGTDALQPETTISIPVRLEDEAVNPHVLHIAVGSVNDQPFLGAPDGMIQYLGAQIRRTAETVYEVRYNFQYVRQVLNVNGAVEVRGGEHHYQPEMTAAGQSLLTDAMDRLASLRADPAATQAQKQTQQDAIRTILYTPENWTLRQHRMYRRVRFQDFPGLENA